MTAPADQAVINVCVWCDEPLEDGRVCRNCRPPMPRGLHDQHGRFVAGDDDLSNRAAS